MDLAPIRWIGSTPQLDPKPINITPNLALERDTEQERKTEERENGDHLWPRMLYAGGMSITSNAARRWDDGDGW